MPITITYQDLTWTLTDNKIVYINKGWSKSKELILSSLTLVTYSRLTSKVGHFSFYYGKKFWQHVSLEYYLDDKENIENVIQHLLNVVGEEKIVNMDTEPNSPKLDVIQWPPTSKKDIFKARLKFFGPIIVIFIIFLIILTVSAGSGGSSDKKDNKKDGFIGSDGEYHSYVPGYGDDVNNWMEENW